MWLQQGWRRGQKRYPGAHWHTLREAGALFGHLPVRTASAQTGMQIPSGRHLADIIERWWPSRIHSGAFLLCRSRRLSRRRSKDALTA